MPNKLHIDQLDFYYGLKRVLSQVAIDIREREITAHTGPSGRGQSTFLRCLNRMNNTLAAQGQWAAAEALRLAALPPGQEIRTLAWWIHASLAAIDTAQGLPGLAAEQAARRVIATQAHPWPGGIVPL